MSKYIKYNALSKAWIRMKQPLSLESPQNLQIDFASKFNYYTLAVCGLTGMWAFHVQMKNTKVRGETFARNYAVINDKYGGMHKEQLGSTTSINKYGYPDVGNNLYSDLLPYADWIRINNAQRCHENMVN